MASLSLLTLYSCNEKSELRLGTVNPGGYLQWEVTVALFERSSISFSLSVPEQKIEFAVSDIPCAVCDIDAEYYEGVGITGSTADN